MGNDHINDNEDMFRERITLSAERIRQIMSECRAEGAFAESGARLAVYFERQAGYLIMLEGVRRLKDTSIADIEKKKSANRGLYAGLLGDEYSTSYLNPAVCVEAFGRFAGQRLSFLAARIRDGIGFVYNKRTEEWAAVLELFIEVYNIFVSRETGEFPEDVFEDELQSALYYYVSDYSDIQAMAQVREMVVPGSTPVLSIIMNSDLSDPSYLYDIGEYISDSDVKVSTFLASLDDNVIDRMAGVYTKGYERGFELAGIDLSKKKTVEIRYCAGFERVVKRAIEQFADMGLECTVRVSKSVPVNAQYDFDHRFDCALYMDKAYKERRLNVMENAFEEYRYEASVYAGPAVIETFGEVPAALESKEEAFSLNAKQKKLQAELSAQMSVLTNRYIKGEERSFTIISWPVPDIGNDFEEIFYRTIELNTLDQELYRAVQEKIIDALNEGEYVHVKGAAGNSTDIMVRLHELSDKAAQTNFENCLADVNIPLGEVFTSPRLAGTDGTINVSSIYINGIEYRDLTIVFKDGMTASVSCSNFEDPAQGVKLIEDNLMHSHAALPMGEFAIGTNTAAYAMARKYGIMDRMKILIIEKTGPHFAVGDTCYSHYEDSRLFNPDGKEIVAKDNEVSIKRRTEPEKAYFGCHTDITIPYDELDEITVISPAGGTTAIIKDGMFVLEGTQVLNAALLEGKKA